MFEEVIKHCPASPYGKPHAGYFATDGSTISWEKCREEFAKKFTCGQAGLFFATREATPGDVLDIAAFLLKTEAIIDLPSLGLPHSTFFRTDNAKAIWVQPSAFWMVCEMRRQVLTIFLRAGLNYAVLKDNYEDALWAEERARESKRAIMRFLFGYVRFIPGDIAFGEQYAVRVGWVTTFGHKDDDAIRKQLVLPEGWKEDYCVVGAGKIWHS
jgi:hypothetical protein